MSDRKTLSVRGLTVEYRSGSTRYTAVEDVSFDCERGAFGAIVGGNGCGKTSLIRAIARLLPSHGGEVLLHGEPVTAPSPRLWVIQQQNSLLPWFTLRRNLEFARRTAASTAGMNVSEALALVGLSSNGQLFPGQLSGGMRQRGELARALVVGPEVVLMDEPFGAIDALSRRDLHGRLLELREQADVLRTGLIVTHDIAEAVQLADWVLVLGRRPGRVVGRVDIDRSGNADDENWRYGPYFQKACEEIEKLLLDEHVIHRGLASATEGR